MLKNIDPILSPELLMLLRAMGHGDEIAIVDANYPALEHARRLVRADGHDAPRLVDAILSVLPLDSDFTPETAFRSTFGADANHMEPVMVDLAAALARHEPKVKLLPLVGAAFYSRVKAAYAVVATGERRLYGNVILRKGVIYPSAPNS
jgi:L-fucose mutarotase